MQARRVQCQLEPPLGLTVLRLDERGDFSASHQLMDLRRRCSEQRREILRRDCEPFRRRNRLESLSPSDGRRPPVDFPDVEFTFKTATFSHSPP